jgi:hypothetical protein
MSSLLFNVVLDSKDLGEVKDLEETYFLNIDTGITGEAAAFERDLFETVRACLEASSLRLIHFPLITAV